MVSPGAGLRQRPEERGCVSAPRGAGLRQRPEERGLGQSPRVSPGPGAPSGSPAPGSPFSDRRSNRVNLAKVEG